MVRFRTCVIVTKSSLDKSNHKNSFVFVRARLTHVNNALVFLAHSITVMHLTVNEGDVGSTPTVPVAFDRGKFYYRRQRTADFERGWSYVVLSWRNR